MLTCTDFGAFGVVVGILVEGNDMARMLVAEDVTASSTVMLAGEKAKVNLAGCIIANNGFRVRLQEEKAISMKYVIIMRMRQ